MKRLFNAEAEKMLYDMFHDSNVIKHIELIESASLNQCKINVMSHDKKVVMTKELTYLEAKFLLQNSYWVKC